MKPILTASLTIAILLAGTSSLSAQGGADPFEADTIRIDSVVSYVSGVGVVPITLFNDEVLTDLEITLLQPSTEVTLDSFVFTGGRLEAAGSNGFALSDDSTKMVIFSFFWSTLLAPGDGLIGNLYLSYSQTIDPQVVAIDTTSIAGPPISHQTLLHIDDPFAESFIPEFQRGYLDIQAAPATFDSIWIDSIGADAGQQVALEVSVYNERPTAAIDLALTYTSDRLQYDSVSFSGTRADPAQKTVQSLASQKLHISLDFGDATPLAAGSGVLARLHFTIDPASPDTLIPIDSATVGLNSITKMTLTAVDGGTVFQPIFRGGKVWVRTITGIEDITRGVLPDNFALSQNYPNPFNPATQIELSLPKASDVTLEVFNVLGRKVSNLVTTTLPAGVHRVTFDGRTGSGKLLASGVYFYRLVIDDFVETKKMILLK